MVLAFPWDLVDLEIMSCHVACELGILYNNVIWTLIHAVESLVSEHR